MNPSAHATDPAGQAANADSKKTIYAVGAPHCAPPSAQWFAQQRGHRLTIFPKLEDCQQALLRPTRVQLVAILVGAQVDKVVNFVYQVRSDARHAQTQLLLLADEGRLIELMPLLRGVAGVDFAAPASSPEFLQQRVAHLLTQPIAHPGEENNPIRVQIVDSVMSRLINSRRRSEMELSRFQQLLGLVAGPVMLFESNTLDCVYANSTAMAMIAPNASPGQANINLNALLPTPGREQWTELLSSGLHRQESVEIEVTLPGLDTAKAWLQALADPRGEEFLVLTIGRSAVAGVMQAELGHQHDLLTGLPGRNLFIRRVEQAIVSAKNSGDPFGLMVMDLDQFKDVNDSLGHDFGDELLRQVGQTLSQGVAETDTVARLGDDDFALLFPQSPDQAAIHAYAERVAQQMRNQFDLFGHKLEIGASIGIAHYPTDGVDGQALLRHAEAAAFQAKRDGLGIVAYEQSHHDNHDQLALKADLREAIRAGDLFLHYQPKVRIDDGRCLGVEALVRWVHPQRGFIPPDEFVALAERTGLIRDLTRQVITKAVEQAARWRAAGKLLCVAVNLSARNLHEPDLVAFVKQQLAEFSLPPNALQFELTESDIMADPATAIAMIEELHNFGIEFAVDDYGTGYSSLAYLKKLRISELKIDRGFISQLNCAGDDMVIVHSTITMAHQLGIRVVAEGVEDQEIWELLDVLECDIAQGYLISRPVSAEQLDEALEQGLTNFTA